MGADKELKRFEKICAHINEIEPNYVKMSDAELAACTPSFRERLEHGETLDDLLPDAFAVMREASSACWACVTSTCRSSAVSPCTTA